MLGDIGIIGWGSYIPKYRVPLEEVGKVVGTSAYGFKSVNGFDEDAITMALEASENALISTNIKPEDIKLITIGTESSSIIYKQIAAHLVNYLGMSNAVITSDINFNTKSGSEALKVAIFSLSNNSSNYALVVGVDMDISKPGTPSELYYSSAASAFILSRKTHECAAVIEGLKTFNINSLDSWSVGNTKLIDESSIINNVLRVVPKVVSDLLNEIGLKLNEVSHVAYTQSNWKVIGKLSKNLGLPLEKFKSGFLYDKIGCSGAASSLISLIATLEVAQKNDLILLVSYGSGFSVDAFLLRVNEKIDDIKRRSVPLSKYINNFEVVDYATYLKFRGFLR